MRIRAICLSAVLLTALGAVLGLYAGEQEKAAPAKAPVEVTYYYLPG